MRLAADGYRVIVNYLENRAAADEVRALIEARGGSCAVKGFDVSQRAQVSQAIDQVTADVGPISILVNNAAVAAPFHVRAPAQPIHSVWGATDEDWDRVVGTNLTGVYNCTRSVVTIMLERKLPRGRIISMGSVGSELGHAVVDHAATKFGLLGFTRALAVRLAPSNITVSIVSPGFIAPDGAASLPSDSNFPIVPLARAGKPEEVAAAVSFLASERSAYVTGQVIRVDGGMYM